MTLKNIIQSLRTFRKWHKGIGLTIAIILLISALTGILLGWKKDADWIQPPTQKGTTKSLSEWKPIEALATIATAHFHQTYPAETANKIDRIDVRPSKGIAKVLFKNGYWEVQIDGKTGAILSTARRHSDWIEALHDGSIISDIFKFISMNLLGVGTVFMIVSGFWLWRGPIKYRRMKHNN